MNKFWEGELIPKLGHDDAMQWHVTEVHIKSSKSDTSSLRNVKIEIGDSLCSNVNVQDKDY